MGFDIRKAERVKRFIEEYCTYSKGEWAGKPFRLIPWQWEQVIKPLFGTLRDDGYRQYRTVYCEIPKKNGKTELCAALGLYMLTNDGEEGAEVYIAASDREQAGLTHLAASAMVRQSDELSGHLRCLDSRKRIIYRRKNSFMQVLSSESYTKHGLSPSCVIIDEIHAHPSDELWNVLTAGTDYARRQQIVFVITTAGIYDKNSIWWRIRSKAQQVAAGIAEDQRFLPVLYLADPEKDDPADEELWKRVNPSLDQIFTLDKIRQDYLEAKENPIDFQNFKRFRLNIPIRQLSKYIPMDVWDRCTGEIDPETLRDRECCGGLDLSSKEDLTAYVLVFPPLELDGRWDVLCKFFCPEDGILKRSRVDRVNYDVWQQQGFLTATPGPAVDYAFIEQQVLEDAKKYRIRQIGYDSWNAKASADRIQEVLNPAGSDWQEGFQMVEIRQGHRSLNEPLKELLVKLLTGKLRHDGNPVLRWNADNLQVRYDPNGNVAPDKEKASEKIDGMVALIMALGRAMFFGASGSVYDERGTEVMG